MDESQVLPRPYVSPLGVQYLAQGYHGIGPAPSPTTRTPSMLCPHWGSNWEPSTSQPSFEQVELPPPWNLSSHFISSYFIN